jgi:hypothetical protein
MALNHSFRSMTHAASVKVGLALLLGFLGLVPATALRAETRTEKTGAEQYAMISEVVTRLATADPALTEHVRVDRQPDRAQSLLSVEYFTKDNQHFAICQVHISVQADSSLWDSVLPSLRPEVRPAFLENVVTHELTHCREFLTAYDDFEASGIVNPALRKSVHNFEALGAVDQGIDQVLWREALADIAGLLYVKEHAPANFEDIRRAMMTWRNTEGHHINHNTFGILHDATLQRGADESAFDAAVRIRNEVYHVAPTGVLAVNRN